MDKVKIGIQLIPQCGDMAMLRQRWKEVEDIGADAIYFCDHFHAARIDPAVAAGETHAQTTYDKNFEATTLQSAVAATTNRIEIGCIVHANSYRNPNLMADIARTIDHISGGRFVLGMGAGYLKADYDEYGFAYGTEKSRVLDLKRDIPIIKSRLEKLNPKPLRKIPLLIGLRIVAEHADMWHVYGPLEKVRQKIEILKRLRAEAGRSFDEIELMTFHTPHLSGNSDVGPDNYLELGIRNICTAAQGPDWDLGELRKLLEWRASLTK